MNITEAGSTIQRFEELFYRFEIPRYLHTDNGGQFTSAEFLEFTQGSGLKHTFSPPGHSVSNGAAENLVETFKLS